METASAIRKIGKHTQSLTGRRTGRPQSATERTRGITANGFLNHNFRPFWAMKTGDYAGTEQAFFTSLSHLLNLYQIPHPQLDGVIYPQNVAGAFEYVCDHFKKHDKKTRCVIIRDELHPASIATYSRYDTRQTLYYIPVNGLWQIVRCKKLEPLANLLFSVFAYLYQVADVPFFRDHSSYLFYEYEMIADWIDEDEGEIEDEYLALQRADLSLMEEAGDRVLNVIRQKATLEQFEGHLESYTSADIARASIIDFGRDFFELFREFPDRSIFGNIQRDLFEDEMTERTRADQYIGFYWSGYDTVNEQLFEMINNELQENTYTEEPASIQIFDQPHAVIPDSLDFENRIFNLIDRLCDLLIPYDNGEHQ